MKKSSITSGIRRLVRWLTTLSYVKLGTAYGCMIIGIGGVYALIYAYAPNHAPNLGGGPTWVTFLNAIYFSIITATSVGYGDILPHGYSKIIASGQTMMSLFIFATIVSKTISERQEAALYQIHKLTFNEIFTSIREGFFVMRKDFDALIEEAKTTNALSIHGKQNFETALHHGEVLIEDIPTFYDNEQELYIIDIRRERLLAQAVERTFERLLTTCNTFKVEGITFTQRTHSTLDELINISTETLNQWSTHSSEIIHPIIDRNLKLLAQIKL